MTATAVVAGAVMTAACTAAQGTQAPTMTVSSDMQCAPGSWQRIAEQTVQLGGAIWIGTVTGSDQTAQVPLTDGSPHHQTYTRVDTTVQSVLAGELRGEQASGWVPGGLNKDVVTEDDGSAWATDGRALFLSYPGDDQDTSPRVDILPIIGDNVITGISPCLGPRNLTPIDSTNVTVHAAGSPQRSAVGQPVPLGTFERAVKVAPR